MNKGAYLLKKPIILKENNKELGKCKDFYVAFDHLPVITYLSYEHFIPNDHSKSVRTDADGVDHTIDMTAAQGMNTFNATAPPTMGKKEEVVKKAYVVEAGNELHVTDDGLITQHNGIQLDEAGFDPGYSYHYLLTLDVVNDDEVIGSISDVIFEGNRVVGFQIFTGGKLFSKEYRYLPIQTKPVIMDNQLRLNKVQVDQLTSDMDALTTRTK